MTGWNVVTRHGNLTGTIDNISETLSEYFNGALGTGGNAGTKPFTNGFTALKSLDSNNDNVFTGLDTAWAYVKLWIDDDHNGLSFKDTNNNGILDAKGPSCNHPTVRRIGTKVPVHRQLQFDSVVPAQRAA